MQWTVKKPDFKIADEPARAQVALILEHYQIDVDGIPDRKQKAATEAALEKLVTFVRQGMIEVSASPFLITQNLSNPPGEVTKLQYPELQGKHKVAMDACGPEEIYARIFALMGSLSGLGSAAFSKINGVDLSAVECLGMLFLSA